eukprot:gene25838-biopygen9283
MHMATSCRNRMKLDDKKHQAKDYVETAPRKEARRQHQGSSISREFRGMRFTKGSPCFVLPDPESMIDWCFLVGLRNRLWRGGDSSVPCSVEEVLVRSMIDAKALQANALLRLTYDVR